MEIPSILADDSIETDKFNLSKFNQGEMMRLLNLK